MEAYPLRSLPLFFLTRAISLTTCIPGGLNRERITQAIFDHSNQETFVSRWQYRDHQGNCGLRCSHFPSRKGAALW